MGVNGTTTADGSATGATGSSAAGPSPTGPAATGAAPPTLPVLPDEATERVLASGLLPELAHAFGGPFHFLLPEAFDSNLRGMREALASAGVEGFVYFAKKANKAAVFAERAAAGGAGVDVASAGELREALGHGVRGEHLVVTGPAKDPALLHLAVRHGALIAVDALDELDALVGGVLAGRIRPARILLRCLPPGQPHSRFGLSEPELATALDRCVRAGDALRMEGSPSTSPATPSSRGPTSPPGWSACASRRGCGAWRRAGSASAAACPSVTPTPRAGTSSSPGSTAVTTTPERPSAPATSTRTTPPSRAPGHWPRSWPPAPRATGSRWPGSCPTPASSCSWSPDGPCSTRPEPRSSASRASRNAPATGS